MSGSSVAFRKRPSQSGPSKSRSKPARHKGIVAFILCLCSVVIVYAVWIFCVKFGYQQLDGMFSRVSR